MANRSRRYHPPRGPWPYPLQFHAFLAALGVSLKNLYEARIAIQCLLWEIPWIPRPIYQRLKEYALLPQRAEKDYRRRYPYEMRDFLITIGAPIDDPDHARLAIQIFLVGPDGRRMPRSLRQALINADLLNPTTLLVMQELVAAERRARASPTPSRSLPASS